MNQILIDLFVCLFSESWHWKTEKAHMWVRDSSRLEDETGNRSPPGWRRSRCRSNCPYSSCRSCPSPSSSVCPHSASHRLQTCWSSTPPPPSWWSSGSAPCPYTFKSNGHSIRDLDTQVRFLFSMKRKILSEHNADKEKSKFLFHEKGKTGWWNGNKESRKYIISHNFSSRNMK